MLSRVADSIYWMNRYIERAENYARFLDVNFNLALELPVSLEAQWEPLVKITGDWELYTSLYGKVKKEKAIYFLGYDENNPNSIYNAICNARENARAVRPDITKEVWEQINYLYHQVKEHKSKKKWCKKDPRKCFFEIKNGCQLVYGIFDATISRTDGWHFGKMGQMIERADKTSRVLDVKYHMLLPSAAEVGTPFDLIQWAALLKSVSAYDMYRKHYGKLQTDNIAQFLILDEDFPRSMLNCLLQAENSLLTITGNTKANTNLAGRKLGLLRSQLEFADINEILQSGMHEFLNNFQIKLNEVSLAIYETFFSLQNIVNQK